MTLPSDKVATPSAEPSDGSRFQEIKKVDLPSDSVLRDRPSSDAATSAAEPSDSTHCQEMDPRGASGDVASSAAEPSDSTHCREMDLPGGLRATCFRRRCKFRCRAKEWHKLPRDGPPW